MSLQPTDLDGFRSTPIPDGYPANVRTLYSPVDDVHAALVLLIKSAVDSVDLAMYGFDDQDLADALLEKMRDESVAVSLTLDSSQAGGVHERAILTGESYPLTTIAVGRSEKGAIMHMKCIVIDEKIRVSGSTNWSAGGEGAQDNELTVIWDPIVAVEASERIDQIHAHMVAAAATAAAKGFS